jgi:hypothetical protein
MRKRLSYHQNVFDLLGYEPPVSAARRKRLRALEKEVGPLPAAVGDWYAREGVVADGEIAGGERRTPADWKTDLWMTWTNFYQNGYLTPAPLGNFCNGLRRVATHPPVEGAAEDTTPLSSNDYSVVDGVPYVVLCRDGYGDFNYVLGLDGSDDPVVRVDLGGSLHEDRFRFSEHVFRTIAVGYLTEWTPTSIFGRDDEGLMDDFDDGFDEEAEPPTFDKPYANGLWLRNPRAAFAAPLLDYLLEQLGEAEVARTSDVTRHEFRTASGLVRVTTDGELSALWAHAKDEAGLAELARLLLPWGELLADTDAARKVLEAERG